MGKNENNILSKRLLRSYFSTVISISLVLFLLGLAGLIVANARSVSNFFKENITVTAILNAEVGDAEAAKLASQIEKFDYVNSARIITKEEGVEEMKKLLGEDFLEVFEVNPIPVSIELQIAPDYVSTDSLVKIEKKLTKISDVSDVVYHKSLVELLNINLERIGIVVIIFTALLLFISVVLINNTVRLNVYSKRFTIHAMRLVGATKGFISRPFLMQAFFQGLIAGTIADFGLLGTLYLVRNEFNQLFSLFDTVILGVVMLFVIGLGILICLFSTMVVVRNLISLTKNELYF